MAQIQGNSSSAGGRLDGSLQKTALTASAFALGAGWGGSTAVLTAGSTDQRGELVITCATGGGLAQATATVTFTFADGAFAAAPWPLAITDNDNSIDTGRWILGTVATTSVVWTYSVLPVNAKIYTLQYLIVA